MRLERRIWVPLLAGALAGALVACAPAGESAPGSATSPGPVASPSSAAEDAAEPTTVATGEVCEGQSDSVDIAAVPEQLDDLGIPFYPCVYEMVAMSGSDPLFVGEYDANQASIIIEMAIKDQFDASDWEVTERSVEGDNAITKAQKPGYSLVVAIGPSRSPDAESSIHYTVRTQ